jgi:malate dehydrogenase (oxaloacetate-decarboxylating)/malate dehydrogenase (oxaloacetate-decarboxylating)(NADP+)
LPDNPREGTAMLQYKILKDENDDIVIEVDSDGFALLHNPILNKGSAFTLDERRLFNMDGFLPSAISTLEDQISRAYENFLKKPTDIERYIFLRGLQDRNEVLFYALITKYLNEMIGIIYTPTVGDACKTYSHIFRYTRGIFLSPENIDRADDIFQSLPYGKIKVIVVTDSEGILGIGDQGIGGMGIPIGKLSLYIAGAGINPSNCLPITLDIGTDNLELQNDPLYLGSRQRRLRGEKYFEFVDMFIEAVRRNFPDSLVQWEDFSKQNAFTLLDKYRDNLMSFNDDIQGTGAVVLAGIKGAMRVIDGRLTEQTFVIYGAGAAGIGVARQIHSDLVGQGLSAQDAYDRIYLLDSRGLLHDGRGGVEEYKRSFSKPAAIMAQWKLSSDAAPGLEDIVANAHPTVLLGLSAQAGSFSEKIVKGMNEHCPRPVIFPLSNPTSKAEATPENICRWTGGAAVVATGSPFPDVDYQGRVLKVGQGNNVFIFPGVGLGTLAVKAKVVTNEMFSAASSTLAGLVSDFRLKLNCVYPPIEDLHEVSLKIAVAVAQTAMDQGVATRPQVPELLEKTIRARMWVPSYARLTKGVHCR